MAEKIISVANEASKQFASTFVTNNSNLLNESPSLVQSSDPINCPVLQEGQTRDDAPCTRQSQQSFQDGIYIVFDSSSSSSLSSSMPRLVASARTDEMLDILGFNHLVEINLGGEKQQTPRPENPTQVFQDSNSHYASVNVGGTAMKTAKVTVSVPADQTSGWWVVYFFLSDAIQIDASTIKANGIGCEMSIDAPCAKVHYDSDVVWKSPAGQVTDPDTNVHNYYDNMIWNDIYVNPQWYGIRIRPDELHSTEHDNKVVITFDVGPRIVTLMKHSNILNNDADGKLLSSGAVSVVHSAKESVFVAHNGVTSIELPSSTELPKMEDFYLAPESATVDFTVSDFSFVKQWLDGSPATGATFTISRRNGSTQQYLKAINQDAVPNAEPRTQPRLEWTDSSDEAQSFSAEEDNKFLFQGFPDGTYTVTEKGRPQGALDSTSSVSMNIKVDGTHTTQPVTVSPTDEGDPELIKPQDVTATSGQPNAIVFNEKKLALPKTGKTGIIPIIAVIMTLFGGAFALVVIYRRRSETL